MKLRFTLTSPEGRYLQYVSMSRGPVSYFLRDDAMLFTAVDDLLEYMDLNGLDRKYWKLTVMMEDVQLEICEPNELKRHVSELYSRVTHL